ncbi:MAG: flap endonuclease-1 [Thermoproteales archaeon]|nr:flap endonuclease-1 [Thermoproteales archaeon]
MGLELGVNLKELVSPIKKEVDLKTFSGKVIAIDAYNILYQFLATIRQRDGTPLMDAYGNVTSHLNGLFYRTINFLENGIKPVYVFDGRPPELKKTEILKRLQIKEEASKKYIRALQRGDLEEARIYAQQTSRLTSTMVDDAKELLTYMGVPWIQAPAEGEAQAAYMTRKGDAWASGSQDYDSLLFGSVRLVRNLGITGKRKLPRKNVYIEVRPEIIVLEDLLRYHGIDRERLVYIALFLGTDYNPEGVKGIGVKKALNIIKEAKTNDAIVKILEKHLDVDPRKIIEIFLNPTVTDDYKISWNNPDGDKIREFLVERHQFSPERVNNALDRALKAYTSLFRQTTLESWFG